VLVAQIVRAASMLVLHTSTVHPYLAPLILRPLHHIVDVWIRAVQFLAHRLPYMLFDAKAPPKRPIWIKHEGLAYQVSFLELFVHSREVQAPISQSPLIDIGCVRTVSIVRS